MRARAIVRCGYFLFAGVFYLAAIIIFAPAKAIELSCGSVTREAKSADIFIAENIAKAYVANKKYDVSGRIFFASKQAIAKAVIQTEMMISRSFMCWNNFGHCQVCVQTSRVDLVWESICREKTAINIIYCCWSPPIIVNMKSDGVSEFNLIYKISSCPDSTICDFRDKIWSFGHQERLFRNVRTCHGGFRDFIGDSNRIFHFAGLNECRDKQSNGGENQSDGCGEESFGEKREFTGISNNIGVRLLLIPFQLRYSLAFFCFFGSLGIGLWGWCNFYNERRFFGASLIFVAFFLGNCGFWLLYPHLLGAPL